MTGEFSVVYVDGEPISAADIDRVLGKDYKPLPWPTEKPINNERD